MARKPTPPQDDPAQSKRFIDMAREVAAEQLSPDFERVFRKVAEQPKSASPTANGGSASSFSRRSSRKGRS